MTDLGVAPFTAYGTLPLTVVRDPTGSGNPDWTPQQVLVGRHVPGSNTTIRQNMGAGPMTVSWYVVLASDSDFQTFCSMVGNAATLRLIAEATSWPGTRQVLYAGDAYKEFDTVTLTAVAPPSSVSMRRWDGTVLCLATFEWDKP